MKKIKDIKEWTTYTGETVKIKNMTTEHINNALLYLQCRTLMYSTLLLGYKKNRTIYREINKKINKICVALVSFCRELKRRIK